jgi:hypothetical protein
MGLKGSNKKKQGMGLRECHKGVWKSWVWKYRAMKERGALKKFENLKGSNIKEGV